MNPVSLIPVILSGGAGTRLWPVSNPHNPKPFIKLKDQQSLLQKTYQLAQSLPHVHEILTVTNQNYYFRTQEEYRSLQSPGLQNSYLLEPKRRNTAAAIVLAAWLLEKKYGRDAILLVLPADHVIENAPAFQQAVQAAIEAASHHQLVTFGITPTYPETGYGYIEVKNPQKNVACPVVQFVEKPNLETATAFVQQGQHFWNAGIFCFQIGTLLEAAKQHAPTIYQSTQICWQQSSQESSNTTELDKSSFLKIPDISIDHALMETAPHISVVPVTFEWRDVGSWKSMSELTAPDAAGNRIEGHATLKNTKNCYVRSGDRSIAVLGAENLIIVDSPEGLLIAHQDHLGQMKQIATLIPVQEPSIVYRPWGTFAVLAQGPGFKVKHIRVKPKQSLSLQFHHHRNEHWVVVQGTALCSDGETQKIFKQNESTYIPAGQKHRLENPGDIDLVMIEVQCGDYLGEDDIVRLEDRYGRR